MCNEIASFLVINCYLLFIVLNCIEYIRQYLTVFFCMHMQLKSQYLFILLLQ